jgi:hypothetical protein
VPVCLAGSNSDPANHWPQPIAEAREKNDLERYACRDVCQNGASLLWYQNGFRADWRVLYATLFHRQPVAAP